jgi:anaerobic ribonucleoside-triphosphate reductase activating protein
MVAVADLAAWLVGLGTTIEGVTISGGEPLQQRPALLALLQRLRQETALSVLLFSGYAWAEIQRLPEAAALLASLDVLIAGRYQADRRLARDLRGSANKTVHLLTDRYRLDDLRQVPPAEVIITPDGQVVMSGIDPLRWV